MSTQTQIEPVLIWKDQAKIDAITAAANSSISYPQAIVSAYNLIEGLPDFSAQSWFDINNDIESFLQGLTLQYYQENYAEAHAVLGLSTEAGLAMVDSSLMPNFSNLRDKVKDFINYNNVASNRINNISPASYTIDAGEIIVDPNFLIQTAAQNSFYLTTQTEIDCKAAIDTLISALIAINTTIPATVFQLSSMGRFPASIDLNDLKQLLKVTIPHGDQLPAYVIDLSFMHKLKQVVITQQLP